MDGTAEYEWWQTMWVLRDYHLNTSAGYRSPPVSTPSCCAKKEKKNKKHKCRVTHYFATEATMSFFFRNNHPAAASHFVFHLITQHKSFQCFLLALLYLFNAFLKLAVTSWSLSSAFCREDSVKALSGLSHCIHQRYTVAWTVVRSVWHWLVTGR